MVSQYGIIVSGGESSHRKPGENVTLDIQQIKRKLVEVIIFFACVVGSRGGYMYCATSYENKYWKGAMVFLYMRYVCIATFWEMFIYLADDFPDM